MDDKKEFFYTEQITTKEGVLYLAMENMHPNWEYYRNSACSLLSGGNKFIGTCGGILEIYENINNGKLDEFLSTRKFPNFWNQNKQLFGNICVQIKKCDFSEGSNKYLELLSINHALSGVNVRSQTHIVYASKNPIKIPFHLRKSDKSKGFEHFYDLYGDIIMSVGVKIDQAVENRGICRNPLSIIAGDYRGISILLHKFTCQVIYKHFPHISMFCVRPMEKMSHILFEKLPKQNLTIDGVKAVDFNGDFICERRFLIPVHDMCDQILSLSSTVPCH